MRKFSASLISGLVALPLAASAQGFPTRNITVIVPFPAGGPSDVVARIVAETMGKSLGQAMVIENVGGAGGTIGSARVASAQPDGYTLLAGSMGSHVSAPALTANMKYDSARDFEPIGMTVDAPAVIVARKDTAPRDLPSFIDHLRKGGAAIKQAHGGVGSSSHMACLLFTSEAGIKPMTVAYRGVNLAINDLLGGHVDFFCEQAVSVSEHVKAGTIKAYAVTGAARLATLPEVPTVRETGLNFTMSIWGGMFAPRGTAKPIVEALAKALDTTLEDPSVRQRLADIGGAAPARELRSPEKFASFVRSEIARWSPVLKEANVAAK